MDTTYIKRGGYVLYSHTILYLSRGRGFGHSVLDIEIGLKIRDKLPMSKVVFASYEDGLRAFDKYKIDCIDLGLAKEDEFNSSKTIPCLQNVVRLIRPQLIISDELFFAPLVAQTNKIKCIFITHWFFSNGGFEPSVKFDKIINLSSDIIMLDIQKFHPKPAFITAPVHYVGPIIRYPDPCTKNIKKPYIVIGVGGCTQLFQILIEKIMQSLIHINKDYHIVVLAVEPYISNHFKQYAETIKLFNSTIYNYLPNPMQIMANAQLVIGRGSYGVMAELAALGTPSVQIVDTNNHIDNIHAHNFEKLGTIKLLNDNVSVDELKKMISIAIKWSVEKREIIFNAGAEYRNFDASKTITEIVSNRINNDICAY